MKTTKKTTIARPKRSRPAPSSVKSKLGYDADFFKWTKTQSNLLKKGNLKDLDIVNLIEEIESLGKKDKRAVQSHLINLLLHMLKLKYQAGKQKDSNSWETSIFNANTEIQLLIEDSPSLRNDLIKVYPKAYQYAREGAAFETKLSLSTFPEKCPWSIEDILPFLKKK